jgi:hypothetical protein
MSFNVGGIDRAVRIVIGLGLIALAFFHVFMGTLAIVAYVVGAIALVTGAFRFCPAWALFGINTRSAKDVK